MMKSILGIVFYFCAILLLVYYFVGVSFIKAIQMAVLITMVHILIHLIDRFYKRKERRKGRN